MVICKECNREFELLDSLRRHRNHKHGINAEQTYIDYVLDGIEPKCKCGCNEKPKYLGINAGYNDYMRGHAARVNNNWGHNKKALEKSHATQKKMHDDGTLKVWNDGLTIEDERVRKNIDKVMANPNRSTNISKKLSGVKKSEEHKIKIKQFSIVRWAKPEERNKQSHRRIDWMIKNDYTVKSKTEEIVNKIIKDLGLIENIDYTRQYYVRNIKAFFDFYFFKSLTLIEIDGDFWHCNPNTKHKDPIYECQFNNLKKDEIKNQWVKDNNIKLLRFWESDINQKHEWVIEELKRELNLVV